MSRIAFLLVGLVVSIKALGQNYPLYNSYITNPFLINPAEAAASQFNVFANYRNQWNGLSGAPKIASIGANTLINDTRAGIGIKASSFKRGFLNTSDVALSYAYGVPIDKKNILFFGLSGGILSNSVDWQMVSDQNIDPALNNLTSSILPAMSFGVHLRNSSGFNIGVALPQMFQAKSFNDNFAIAAQDNIVLSAYYSNWHPQPKVNSHNRRRSKRKKSQGSPLELYSLVRYSNVGIQVEGSMKLNVHSSFWLSGGYRKASGIIPGIGINLNALSIGYFYESGIVGDIPLKSHEISLSLKLGDEKKFRDKPKPDDKPLPPAPRPRFGLPDPNANAPKISNKTPKGTRLPDSTNKNNQTVTTNTEPKNNQTTPEVTKNPVVTQTETNNNATNTTSTPRLNPQNNITPPSTENTTPTNTETTTPTNTQTVPTNTQNTIPANTETTTPPNTETTVPTTNTEATVPAHEDEQEKLARLEEHADNPTEEHKEANHPHAERHEFVRRGDHQSELGLGDYVIVGVFRGEVNAKHFSDELKKLGFSEVDYGFLSEKNIWYVHIADSEDIEEAKTKRDKYRKMKMFKDAWLLTVHQ